MSKRDLEIKQRGRIRRKTKPVYLIIAEGKNKTETLYFSNFQKQGNPYSLQFVKAGNKTDAESLYETIKTKWKQLELSSNQGDRGFIVLDMDNDPNKAKKVIDLIQSNKNDSIMFLVSNPTFEVWLLLHFGYTTRYFADGNAVIKELRKYIPDYEKSKDCFSVCSDRLQEAIKNAKKLEKHFGNNTWPSAECNPRTDILKIIEILNVWQD